MWKINHGTEKKRGGESITANINDKVALEVTLLDAAGAPLADRQVSVRAAAGLVSEGGDSFMTDPAGKGIVNLKFTGPNSYVAFSAIGETITPFIIIKAPPAPATPGDNPNSSPAPTARWELPHAPLPGHTVRRDVTNCPATVNGTPCNRLLHRPGYKACDCGHRLGEYYYVLRKAADARARTAAPAPVATVPPVPPTELKQDKEAMDKTPIKDPPAEPQAAELGKKPNPADNTIGTNKAGGEESPAKPEPEPDPDQGFPDNGDTPDQGAPNTDTDAPGTDDAGAILDDAPATGTPDVAAVPPPAEEHPAVVPPVPTPAPVAPVAVAPAPDPVVPTPVVSAPVQPGPVPPTDEHPNQDVPPAAEQSASRDRSRKTMIALAIIAITALIAGYHLLTRDYNKPTPVPTEAQVIEPKKDVLPAPTPIPPTPQPTVVKKTIPAVQPPVQAAPALAKPTVKIPPTSQPARPAIQPVRTTIEKLLEDEDY